MNQREFSRVQVHREVQVTAKGHGKFTGQLRDISMNGLFLDVPVLLPPGTACQVKLQLDSGSQDKIEARGRVVRSEQAGLAIEFCEFLGLESYCHLRSLLLFNAPHPGTLEDEFRDHLGLRKREQPLPDAPAERPAP